MAKDRFSKQKPIYWNTGFKQTGSFIKPEFNSAPKRKARSEEQTDRIKTLYQVAKNNLTTWENDFMLTILSHDFILTPKQNEIIQRIKQKFKSLYFEDSVS